MRYRTKNVGMTIMIGDRHANILPSTVHENNIAQHSWVVLSVLPHDWLVLSVLSHCSHSWLILSVSPHDWLVLSVLTHCSHSWLILSVSPLTRLTGPVCINTVHTADWSYLCRLEVEPAGKFSSPGSTFCADSHFGIRSTPMLPH